MPQKNSRSLSIKKGSRGGSSTPRIQFANSIMKKYLQIIALLLFGVAPPMIAMYAISTHYSGRIDLKVNLGPGSGRVTIDGRPNNPPTLPSSE